MFAVMDKLRDNFFMDIDNKLEKIKASEIEKSIKEVNKQYRESIMGKIGE